MGQVTYADKSSGGSGDPNGWTAGNANEVKSAVNSNNTAIGALQAALAALDTDDVAGLQSFIENLIIIAEDGYFKLAINEAVDIGITPPIGGSSWVDLRTALLDIESRIVANETGIGALDQAIVLKGTWDASSGSFPGGGSAQAGWKYLVSVAGTVDGVDFQVGDTLTAILDNASTSTYASNWFKAENTESVFSVAGKSGAVTLNANDVSETTGKNWFTDVEKAKLAALPDPGIGFEGFYSTLSDLQTAIPTGANGQFALVGSATEYFAIYTWNANTASWQHISKPVLFNDSEISGTSHQLAPADHFRIKNTTNGSAVTITVPPNSTTSFTENDEFLFQQDGNGEVEFVFDAGATVYGEKNTSNKYKIAAKGGMVWLKNCGADTWRISGRLDLS